MTNPTYMSQLYCLSTAVLAQTPVILWGAPGVGKTTVMRQLSAARGRHQETVIAAIRGPEEFGGLPIVNQSEGTTSMAPPTWATRIADNGGGDIFLDEVSTSPPSVQAALLRPVLENTVGDLTLPSDTAWVAAANPPDIATDGFDLAPPLANRFLHLDWQMPSDVIADGFMFGWPDIPVVSYDTDRYEAALSQIKVKIGTFLGKIKPELGLAMPETADETGKAWPSPRSWTQAAHLLAVIETSDLPAEYRDQVRILVTTGSIGEGAGTEFLAWERQMDLPDPETLIANPTTWDVPTDLDKVYAITGSVFAAWENNEKTTERWIAVGDVYGRIAEAGYGDVAWVACRRWAADKPADPKAIPSAYSMDHLSEILVTLGDLIG